MNAFTLYSDSYRDTSAPEEQRRSAYTILEQLRADPPGAWTANRYSQVQHDVGIVYVAIRAIMDVILCSSVSVQRKRKPIASSLFKKSHDHQHDDDRFEPVDRHPLVDLIERPNQTDTFNDILSYIVLQNKLTGFAPMWTIPNQAGRPVELYALPAALTTPQWQRTPEYPTGAWRVQPYYASGGYGFLPTPYAGSGVIIPNDEIARLVDPHPLFKWSGKAPLEATAFQLDILEQIDQARWAAFEHGVTMDAVLQVDGFNDAQVERLQTRMEQRAGGTKNHRRFLVVSGQAGTERTRLHTFSNNPREMDFQSSWQQMAGFALAVFGVPMSVAGLSDATSYSELYAALRQFYQRQKSLAKRIGEFLTRSLAWPYSKRPGELIISVDLPPLDDPDLAERQLETDLTHGTITYNEARLARGREPVDGGDVPAPIYVESLKPQPLAPMPGDPNAIPADEEQPGTGQPGQQPTGPFSGAVQGEDNPAGEDTRPPLQKAAMSSLDSQRGGVLVPPVATRVGLLLSLKRRVRKIKRKALKPLGEANAVASDHNPEPERSALGD